jgi:hypothetical protein
MGNNINGNSAVAVFSTKIGELTNGDDLTPRNKPEVSYDHKNQALIIRGLQGYDHHLRLAKGQTALSYSKSGVSTKNYQSESIDLTIPNSAKKIIFLGTDSADSLKVDRGHYNSRIVENGKDLEIASPNLEELLIYTGDGTDKVTVQGFPKEKLAVMVNPGDGIEDDVFIADFPKASVQKSPEDYNGSGLKVKVQDCDHVDLYLANDNMQVEELGHDFIRNGSPRHAPSADVEVINSKTLDLKASVYHLKMSSESKHQESVRIDQNGSVDLNLEAAATDSFGKPSLDLNTDGGKIRIKGFVDVKSKSEGFTEMHLSDIGKLEHSSVASTVEVTVSDLNSGRLNFKGIKKDSDFPAGVSKVRVIDPDTNSPTELDLEDVAPQLEIYNSANGLEIR